MVSVALTLLAHAMLLSLHLSNGSFPRPLSAKEERACVARMLEGDMDARNTLIEHNLRLVAHVVKKYYTRTEEQARSASSRAFPVTAPKKVPASQPTLQSALRMLYYRNGTNGG